MEPITEREHEVLRLMAQALTYEGIAGALGMSVNTVRFHVKNLYGKLGARSRTEALANARALDLL